MAENPEEEINETAARAQGDEKEPEKLRILSIDGGGVRGIIPARILKYLEEQLEDIDKNRPGVIKNRPGVIRLADYFDLIVGTSTGGLIAALITTPDPKDPQKHPLSAEGVLKFYKDHAAKIFPPVRGIVQKVLKKPEKMLRGPKYKPKELDKLLKDHCVDRKLSGAHTAVIIPSFDIKRQQPVFFSSWEPRLNAALVADVCLATTAAPTFLPPVYFTVPPTEGKKKKKKEEQKDHTKKRPQTQAVGEILEFNMIDGGMAVNNPTYVGITQAIRHFSLRNSGVRDYFDKLFVLSLGTGQHRRGYSAKEAKKWGAVKWLKHNGDTPLISSLQNASADMVDYNLSIMFGAHQHAGNYLRIQTEIPPDPPKLSKLDNAKEENLEQLEELGRQLLEKPVSTLNFNTGELVVANPNYKFKQALRSFAEDLSRMRGPGRSRFRFHATS